MSEFNKLIVEVAKGKGFTGTRSGKFVFSGKPVASNLLIATLGLPDSLKTLSELEFYKVKDLKVTALKAAVQSVLSEYKITPNIDAPTIMPQQDLTDSYGSLDLYKVASDAVHDKGLIRSSGYSLVAFNRETGHLVDWRVVNPDVVLKRRGITRMELPDCDEIPEVVLKFNPLTPELAFYGMDEVFGSGREILYANTAVPAYWMKDPKYNKLEPKLGPFISVLLEHLFPLPSEREDVLDWCHNLLFKRNNTVLCLAGDRGTGKTSFVEILELLVGKQYSETVNEAVIKDKFNSQLHNKRFAVFEEVSLEEKSSVAKIKAWCNHKISIEKKGQDAFTAENWASMVFLMNDITNLGINAQERRFSIPAVAEKGLLTVIDVKEVARFKDGMLEGNPKVLAEIAQLGHFLKARVPRTNEYTPIKGEYFFKVADATMKEWEYTLREHILDNGIVGKLIPIEKIFPKVGKDTNFPHKKGTIQAWLSEYRYRGIHKIGTIQEIVKEKPKMIEGEEDFTSLDMGSSRTRRNYGVMPNPDLLRDFGKKVATRAEDLL